MFENWADFACCKAVGPPDRPKISAACRAFPAPRKGREFFARSRECLRETGNSLERLSPTHSPARAGRLASLTRLTIRQRGGSALACACGRAVADERRALERVGLRAYGASRNGPAPACFCGPHRPQFLSCFLLVLPQPFLPFPRCLVGFGEIEEEGDPPYRLGIVHRLSSLGLLGRELALDNRPLLFDRGYGGDDGALGGAVALG